MKIGNTHIRTTTNYVYKIVNGVSVYLHKDSIHNIVDLQKYGKSNLYAAMKKIQSGKLSIEVDSLIKDINIKHFVVKENGSLEFHNY